MSESSFLIKKQWMDNRFDTKAEKPLKDRESDAK